MGRAPCCDKANVKKGPWSPEEDAKLKSYIEQHGTGGNWIALPQKIGLKRCGKSCRLRWLNYLRPNIRHGGFSEEEDKIICNLYISIGSRWSIIAAQLAGRTDNDIKNYWNTRLKKKLLGKYNKHSTQDQYYPNKNPNGLEDHSQLSLSSSAIERLQLHMQLQGLEINPSALNFYNNHPQLWPNKLHNFQEKMILNETTNPILNLNPLMQHSNHHLHLPESSSQPASASASASQNVIGLNNNTLVSNPTDSINMMEHDDHQQVSTFQAEEFDDFVYNNNKAAVNFIEHDEGRDRVQIGNEVQYDCFNISANNTSNSWDYSSAVDQSSDGIMFQDYEVLLGYNL